MISLHIDVETFSSENLGIVGMHKYMAARDFEIMLFAYRFDGEETVCLDLTNGDQLPIRVIRALTDPTVKKKSYNAPFEIHSIEIHFNMRLDRSQWECIYVKSMMVGLPGKLEICAKALNLPVEKDTRGKALIKIFCVPCKPTKANGMRKRNMPYHFPEKWVEFKSYNITDVDVECAIDDKIAFFKIPESEKELWLLDQKINNAGVGVDIDLIEGAMYVNSINSKKLIQEAKDLTGLQNPKSPSQIKRWILDTIGLKIPSLAKDILPDLLEKIKNKKVKKLIELRKETSQTSITKFKRIALAVGADGRLRGLFQFYGALRTGRFAGRGTQVHNLKKNDLAKLNGLKNEKETLEYARSLIKEGNVETLYRYFNSISEVLSHLIRTAFVAATGKKFLVADFAAIEARVLAWLAGEKWRLDVFGSHGKIYEASASKMFNIPIEEVVPGSEWRHKGKVAELALGYQGAIGALVRMGALKMGLLEEELLPIVRAWRRSNKAIVALWAELEECAIECLTTCDKTYSRKGIVFSYYKDIMWIKLPGGRRLAYWSPRIKINAKGKKYVSYMGVDQDTKQWGREQTYGGKLTENIVQAIARDLLTNSMIKLDRKGYPIVLHVHDENIAEVKKKQREYNVEDMCSIMSQPVIWAKGLPLKAEGYETEFYYKK